MMKKILYALIYLPLLALLMTGCEKKEEIVFDHEKPQFELNNEAILLEVIMPQGTSATDEIYIVGDFNGGDAAIGDLTWKLEKAAGSDYKWGVYLYPSTFQSGKTLADGFNFTSVSQGVERSIANDTVVRTLTATVGTRTDLKVQVWSSYFNPPLAWPDVPSGQIMLRITVSNNTPENSMLALYGVVNDWNGSDHTKWGATMMDPLHYYLYLDPANFTTGTTLASEFKFGLIRTDKDWWYHQPNVDGSATEIAGFTIENAAAGKAYNLTVQNWSRSDEILQQPWAPDTRVKLTIKVPDYTPLNSVVVIRGELNNWDLENKAEWTATYVNDTTYELLVDPVNCVADRSLDNNYKICLVLPGVGPWYHQANEDGSDAPGGYFQGASAEVLNWRNKSDIPLGEPMVVRWRQPGNEWGGQMAIYAWGGSPAGDVFGGWPGKVVTPDAEGWYSVEVPFGQTIGNVIFHNNDGTQFDAPEVKDLGPGTYSYEIGTTGGSCVLVSHELIRWQQPGDEWGGQMAVYAWGGTNGDTFGGWPGKIVTPDAQGWYTVLIPAGDNAGNVIFNNNNGGAQFDATTVTGPGCYEITGSAATAVDCP